MMYQIRQYALLPYKKEHPESRFFWRLVRDARGNDAHTDELFDRGRGEKDEDGLTKAAQFLMARGERIIGIHSDWRGLAIFTEPVPQTQTEATVNNPDGWH